MRTAITQGGCLCGAIRYAVYKEPGKCVVCHCPDCRRAVGAQSVAYMFLALSDYEVIQGAPVEFASSLGVLRKFCGRCGTTLSWESEQHPGRIDVTLGSLDSPERFPPSRAVYRKYKLSWASEI
jgi:hypothetical protein